MSYGPVKPIVELAPYLKRDFVSHRRRVQNLFKRCVRNEESYLVDKFDIKFAWATIRAEFEKHRHVRDLRLAKMLVEEAELKLYYELHPQPRKFPHSPGGILFERDHVFPDLVLDYWHPLEKAEYPYYFERREQLKQEFLLMWEKNQGNNADQSKPSH